MFCNWVVCSLMELAGKYIFDNVKSTCQIKVVDDTEIDVRGAGTVNNICNGVYMKSFNTSEFMCSNLAICLGVEKYSYFNRRATSNL